MAITKLNSLAIPDDTIVEADLSYPLTGFSSTGIDDNATSTALTVTDSGIAATLTTAAQPNITSVGTLTSFSSTGIDDNATSTAITIDASENVGIGRTDPQHNLHIQGSSDSGIQVTKDGVVAGRITAVTTGLAFGVDTADGTTERIRVDSDGIVKLITANDTSGTTKRLTFGTNAFNRAEIRCTNDATYDGILQFHTGNSSNYLERMRITAAGDTVLAPSKSISVLGATTAGDTSYSGKLSCEYVYPWIETRLDSQAEVSWYGAIAFRTKDLGGTLTERARISSNGLSFNGDTAAANALDDYEEGTSTTFVYGITATTNEVKMNYVKVGSLVHIIGEVNISGKSAGASNPYFMLPFSPSSTFAFTSTVGASIHYNTISSTINYFGLYTSNAAVYGNTTSGTYGNNYVWNTAWSDGRIGFSLTYTTF